MNLVIDLSKMRDPMYDFDWIAMPAGSTLLGGELPPFLRLFGTLVPDEARESIIIFDVGSSQATIHSKVSIKEMIAVAETITSTFIYVVSCDSSFALYSNYRDGVTVLRITAELAEPLISRFDRLFMRHMASGGIGFGAPGRAYALQLLKGCISAERLSKLTRLMRLAD